MKTKGQELLERLRYHVTGAIERGEAEAITEQKSMKLQISITMDNAAFEDNGGEAARILKDLARTLEARTIDEDRTLTPDDAGPLHDANGNRVGKWEVTR